MLYTILGGTIYALWLLLPPIALVIMIRRRARLWLFGVLGLALTLLACPAYTMLLIFIPGWAWPPDIFMPGSESRIGATIPGYRIDYVQIWGMDFYETYFEVTRADGQKAFLEIDGDDNKCWGLSTRQLESKIYFLCGQGSIDEQTSYLDIDRRIVYAGFVRCARSLNQLTYRDDAINPLASSRWLSSDVLCWDTIQRIN